MRLLAAVARYIATPAVVAAVLPAVLTTGLERRAYADDAPNAERLRSAASEYDAGRRAFGEKDYEGAATHFENAYHDAANASALRSAIRARQKAGQLARAATLANIAAVRYPKDAATMAVVHEVLKASHVKLDRVTLHCTPDCGVAADGRAISVEDATETVFYLDPGDHEVVVSWSSDRNKSQKFTAMAGGEDTLTFEAPPVAAPPPPVVVDAPPAATLTTTNATRKPLPPAVFYAGAGLTVASVGVLVWSGVSAENDPGAAAVRRDCVGKGTSCPEYQQGLSAQLRTNILIGTTAGLGAATAVIGVFLHPLVRQGGRGFLDQRPGQAGVRGRAALLRAASGRRRVRPQRPFLIGLRALRAAAAPPPTSTSSTAVPTCTRAKEPSNGRCAVINRPRTARGFALERPRVLSSLKATHTGERLDRFELIAEIASGGMATVYLARLEGVAGFQRLFAIKRLHPHLANEAEFVDMFLDEARLAARIHHPNVVSILEVGMSDQGYYLVMDYIEGDTAARLLARASQASTRLPPGAAVRIALDTLFGCTPRTT